MGTPPPLRLPGLLRGRKSHRTGEGKSLENLGARDLVHDKDETAAPIPLGPIWGPRVEPFRGKQRVLRRLHDRRAVRAIGKAHDAFDAQQVAAARRRQTAQGARKIQPADFALEDHPEGVDAMGMRHTWLCRHYGSRRSRRPAEQHGADIAGFGGENALGPVIDPIEPADEVGAEWSQIGLTDHQHIGKCGLPVRLGKALQCLAALNGVDKGDDPG